MHYNSDYVDDLKEEIEKLKKEVELLRAAWKKLAQDTIPEDEFAEFPWFKRS